MKIKILITIIVFLIIFGSFGLANNISKTENLLQTSDEPTLFIEIVEINEIDPIDINVEPDWEYTIEVCRLLDNFRDPLVITDDEMKTHSIDFLDIQVGANANTSRIKIILKDKDLTNPDDAADISGKPGQNPSDEDGKEFTVYYNLDNNTISPLNKHYADPELREFYEGETWSVEGEYIIINGENDGRGPPGPEEDDDKEDDAEMKIKIYDNVDELNSLSLYIVGNPKVVTVGEEITFKCSIQGGTPPYSYNIFPKFGTDLIDMTSNENTITIDYTYNSGTGEDRPILYLWDNLNSNILYQMSPIILNNPPTQPTKPIRQGLTYTSHSSDLDANSIIFYNWWYDGKESGWIENGNSITLEGFYNQVKVKAKDQYGAESTYSEPCIKSKNKENLISEFWNIIIQKYDLFLFTFLGKISSTLTNDK